MQYFAQHCEFRMVDEMLDPFKSALRLLKLKAPRQNLTMFLIEMSNTYYIKKKVLKRLPPLFECFPVFQRLIQNTVEYLR